MRDDRFQLAFIENDDRQWRIRKEGAYLLLIRGCWARNMIRDFYGETSDTKHIEKRKTNWMSFLIWISLSVVYSVEDTTMKQKTRALHTPFTNINRLVALQTCIPANLPGYSLKKHKVVINVGIKRMKGHLRSAPSLEQSLP